MALAVEDIDHVLAHTAEVWPRLAGKHLFITGGSGFFGCWLLETLLGANRRLGLDIKAVVLTRNPARLRQKLPHLAGDPALQFLAGDLRDFAFPQGRFDYLIHAAATPSAALEQPVDTLDAEIEGLRRVFAFARQSGVRRVLFTSSGALYGAAGDGPIPESTTSAPDPVRPESAYGELKRLGELYGVCCARQFGLEVIIARCFAAFGPYQDLNSHFAVPSFLKSALGAGDIVVHGDGLSRRSYLYAADLAVWLWRLFLFGESCRPYNVGSSVPTSILQLAQAIASVVGREDRVRVLGRGDAGIAPKQYLPDVDRAAGELNLKQWVGLDRGLARTIAWHRQQLALDA
jgi:dTDP-glucose 4,6-dehydratase